MNLPLPPGPARPASAQPVLPPQAPGQPAAHRGWARRLADFAVAVVVIAVAGAAFVFSYSGVHAVALLGGVSPQLARYYPALFDALLVVACVAAVVLRDGRWWARLWAWLVVIVVLAAIGWVDVIHAIHYGLKHRPTEGAVAAAPVAAVLLAFSLLLTILRQAKPRPAGASGRHGAHGAHGRRAPRDAEDGPATETMPTILLPAVSASPGPSAAISAGPLPGGAAPDAVTAMAPVPPTEVPALPPAEIAATWADPVVAATAWGAPGEQAWSEPAGSQDEPGEPGEPTAPADLAEADSPSARTRSIRYAGKNARDKPAPDYWDGEDDPELAGQVYPAQDNGFEEAGERYDPQDSQAQESADADANDAPFATIPRLNRARVTPTPPRDDED